MHRSTRKEANVVAEAAHTKIAPPLAQLWQLPVLAAGLMLFGIGLYLAKPKHTPTPYAQNLNSVQALIDAGQYDHAIDALEDMASQLPNMPVTFEARFRRLRGDARYLLQKSRGWSDPAGYQPVVADLEAARSAGLSDSTHIRRLADSLAATGKTGPALELLAELGDAGADARQAMLRQIIESAMSSESAIDDEAADLVRRMLSDPSLTPANEAWAVARQAELLMHESRISQTIDLLLRRLARLQDVPEAPLGELRLKLAQAYLAEGKPTEAETWLLRAQQAMDSTDPLNAQVLVSLGHIRFAEDNIVEALEHFVDATDRYPATAPYPEALIGKAEAEARLGAMNESLADYEQAANLIAKTTSADSTLRKRLIESLEAQHDLRFGQRQYDLALQFLSLNERLHSIPPPNSYLLKLALTHEQIARQLLGEEAAGQKDGAAMASVTPAVQAQVLDHYEQAARLYQQHAHAVRADDDDAHGQSLWKAADLFDKAGLHVESIKAFDDFIAQRGSDPKALSAMFRLAQAHQAGAEFDDAVAMYERLIEQHPKSPEAYAALVPLARSYLAQGPKFMDKAEHVLQSVVNDHPALTPESREYREALIELGQLYYQRGGEGDYEKAIEHLDAAIKRYQTDAPVPELMFRLADAYRKSVDQIDDLLAGALPPSRRAALSADRTRRLLEARQAFDAVIKLYEQVDPKSLDTMQNLYLRNSYFYRADCAYDLGQYEGEDGAIELYEIARRKYHADPASLVALVQIVNSYSELGNYDKARSYNNQAKVFLKAIPEEKFNDPNLPMDRDHWQRWLEWTSQLGLKDTAATTSVDAP